KKTVLVEHFTNDNLIASNDADNYLSTEYAKQFLNKKKPDFLVIQYHITHPTKDILNENNPEDPRARALNYGVQQSPTTIMDGILGKYNGVDFGGQFFNVNGKTTDQRALEDAVFDIAIDTIATANNAISGSVKLTYVDSVNT